MGNLVTWLRSLFFKREMELTFLGLSNAGKTTLANTLCHGPGQVENTIPTIGMNMRQFSQGNVDIKLWDVGGQREFRRMWERYCSGCGAIVYVVDSAETEEALAMSREELLTLLEKPSLEGIPLLVVANKNDLENARSAEEIIHIMDLEMIDTREVSCYSVSALNGENIDRILQWLLDHGQQRTEG